MKGYIATDNVSVKNCKNGVENHLKGRLNYEKNGFYFSDSPEVAIWLSPSKSINKIREIEAKGMIICGNDYFENVEQGIEGIYACDTLLLKEPMSRDDIVATVFNSGNILRAEYIMPYVKLTPVEIYAFLQKYGDPLSPFIEYYQ